MPCKAGDRRRLEQAANRQLDAEREPVAQLPHVDVTSCDEVRAQIPGAIGVVAIDDGYVAHAWTRPQRVLDRGQLDAFAANLDLMIPAAAELERSIRQHAPEIASLV